MCRNTLWYALSGLSFPFWIHRSGAIHDGSSGGRYCSLFAFVLEAPQDCHTTFKINLRIDSFLSSQSSCLYQCSSAQISGHIRISIMGTVSGQPGNCSDVLLPTCSVLLPFAHKRAEPLRLQRLCIYFPGTTECSCLLSLLSACICVHQRFHCASFPTLHRTVRDWRTRVFSFCRPRVLPVLLHPYRAV